MLCFSLDLLSIMKKLLTGLILLILVSLISLPIILYINQFGFGVWDKHEDWARMGSYFGGVVGPIITTISLLFLGWQIGVQTKQRKEENTLHVCAECETDINNYLPKIIEFVSTAEKIETIKLVLAKNKYLVENGQQEEATEMIKDYISTELAICSMWFHIDACLRTLQKSKMYKFKRMRTRIFSEVEIEFIAYLEGIRMATTNSKTETCLFPG